MCKRKCTKLSEDNYLEEEVIREIGLAMAKKAKNQKAKLGRKKRVEEGKKESESKKNSLPVNANLRNETESMEIEESITMRERGEGKNFTKKKDLGRCKQRGKYYVKGGDRRNKFQRSKRNMRRRGREEKDT